MFEFFEMFKFFDSFVVLQIVSLIIFVNGQEKCSDVIKYTNEGDTKVANVDLYLGPTTDNTLAQVNVFVPDECEESYCKLVPQLPLKKIKVDYLNFDRVPFKIVFSGPAKDKFVQAIGFKNSNECKIVCKYTNKLTPGGKLLKYSFYPNGRTGSKEADCSLYETYGKVGITAGHIRTAVETADCGVPAQLPIELAVFGMRTEKGQWPWLVDIEARQENGLGFICGGTLVNQRVVITAAHCLYDPSTEEPKMSSELSLFLGRYNRSDFNEGTYVQYGVEHYMVHPDYRPRGENYDADIGFLVTNEIVKYTPYIKPACIWEGADSIKEVLGEQGTIVGWGVDETGNETSIPYKVEGRIVSEEECEAANFLVPKISTRRNFCAGNNDRSGPCKGDSGGAFLLKKLNKWTVRGTVSASFPSLDNQGLICDTNKHAIYTDVAKFRQWLDKETNKYFDKNYF